MQLLNGMSKTDQVYENQVLKICAYAVCIIKNLSAYIFMLKKGKCVIVCCRF